MRFLALGLALILFAHVLRAADAREVLALVTGVGVGGVLLAMLPQLVSLALETVGWKLTFRAGGSPVRFAPLLRVRVATEALAQSLPVGVAFAESVKPLLLRKHCGLVVARSLAGMTGRKVLILIAQSAYVGALASLGFSGLEALGQQVFGLPHLGWLALGAGAVLGVLGVAIALTLRQSAVARGTLGLLARMPSAKLRALLAERERAFAATDGAVSALFRAKPAKLAVPTLFFLGGWLMESVETWFLLTVLGAHPSFVAVGAIEVVVSLVRNVVFVVPAGLGVQDLGYVSCFAAFGVPDAASTGAAFVLLKRGKELFWIVVGYALLGSELGALLRGSATLEPRDVRLRPAGA
jgi:glycosyltransferase 2 family protein